MLYIWDTNGSIGGPVQRDRLWFHHAMRSWGSSNAVVGGYYNATPDSWFYTPDRSRPANTSMSTMSKALAAAVI